MDISVHLFDSSGWLGGVTVDSRTLDQMVVGLIPGRVAIR